MQVSFDFGEISPKIPEFSATDVLIDRGSRYSYAFARIDSPEGAMKFMKSLRTKKPFQNADHNSYAYRFRTEEGIIIEWKWDDGEVGAGLCILRELRRANVSSCCVVVSRHFGGVKLMNDRFKHVVDVTKIAIEQTQK